MSDASKRARVRESGRKTRVAIAIASFAAVAAAAPDAGAQPVTNRSVLVIHGPPKAPRGMRVTVELEGRVIPREAFETQMIVQPGKRLVRTSVVDASGKPVLEPSDQLVTVVPGSLTEVTIPNVASETDGTLIGGGIAVVTLGTLSGIWSVLSFIAADASGSDCHESGFAKDLCGADPAPWVGMGITGLLFGAGGLIGGTAMIVIGTERTPAWVSPVASPNTFGVSAGFAF